MSYFGEVKIKDVLVSIKRLLSAIANPPWYVKATNTLGISGNIGTVTTVTGVTAVTGLTNIGSVSAATLVNDTNKIRTATAIRRLIT